MANRELVIRIYMPKWGWRGWVGLLTALVAFGGAIAWANVVWTPFNHVDLTQTSILLM